MINLHKYIELTVIVAYSFQALLCKGPMLALILNGLYILCWDLKHLRLLMQVILSRQLVLVPHFRFPDCRCKWWRSELCHHARTSRSFDPIRRSTSTQHHLPLQWGGRKYAAGKKYSDNLCIVGVLNPDASKPRLEMVWILKWIWNLEARPYEICKNGLHFVKNHLKFGQKHLDFECSCF